MPELCRHCQGEVALHYCPSCGQPRVLNRINGRFLLGAIGSVLSVEQGFVYTIRTLLSQPGKGIAEFLQVDRAKMTKPVVFLILTSLIYSLFNNILQIEEGYIQFTGDPASHQVAVFAWIQSNYGYANTIMAVFIGCWLQLFFWKTPFNFFEILVLLCYVMGISMLIYTFFGFLQMLVAVKILQIAGVVGFVYHTWAVGQFYGKRKFLNYVKAFLAYFLGFLSFALFAVLVGTLLDVFLRHPPAG